MSRPTRGHIGLNIGQRTVAIDFGRFVLDDFALQCYVENETDAPPILALRATPTTRILTAGKITGCTVELNGAPDTPNYVVRWVLA